ncbi:unnamed protein product [Rangifer tarandus platyrhynchus]|uniref:Uncharacterized protein n=2 Tax=Rangifer tarandus platyrhynchus TaxID=3082113 RepID=A0ABN8YYQ9_RANTA|nr:unnamed protein product [Rangifer tarandus platyrhynchus]CAI9705502.1 unnamed protein product [Rangifer tarandus platyrhynchus]
MERDPVREVLERKPNPVRKMSHLQRPPPLGAVTCWFDPGPMCYYGFLQSSQRYFALKKQNLDAGVSFLKSRKRVDILIASIST